MAQFQFTSDVQLNWVRLNGKLDTIQGISEMICPATLLTGANHSAFSTNHLTDIDKTEQNYSQTTQKPQRPDKRTTIICAKLSRFLNQIKLKLGLGV